MLFSRIISHSILAVFALRPSKKSRFASAQRVLSAVESCLIKNPVIVAAIVIIVVFVIVILVDHQREKKKETMGGVIILSRACHQNATSPLLTSDYQSTPKWFRAPLAPLASAMKDGIFMRQRERPILSSLLCKSFDGTTSRSFV